MASFGRMRRAPNSPASAAARPLVALLAASLVLLVARDTAFVRAAATSATELLVPVERVLGGVGSPFSHAWQAGTQIETPPSDKTPLPLPKHPPTLQNIPLTAQTVIPPHGARPAACLYSAS